MCVHYYEMRSNKRKRSFIPALNLENIEKKKIEKEAEQNPWLDDLLLRVEAVDIYYWLLEADDHAYNA